MEKLSNPAELSRALRRALGGLTQSELATKLLLSRNYISHIEAGLKLPSARVLAQMHGMLPKATSQNVQKEHEEPAVGEPRGRYAPLREVTPEESQEGEAAELSDQIRTQVERSIAATKGDVGRLGWLREQAEQHLRPPERWSQGLPEPKRRPATVVLVPRAQLAQPHRHGQSTG
ncbi:MAG: helix-turn-helix transcriptional regulator [Opitutaceae bacterium]|nr:helix-turn-helix transcriptional regulator [Opitutaceae bacterium]